MWRTGLEAVLGFRLEEGNIRLRPALPHDWSWYEIDYRPDGLTSYAIRVEQVGGRSGVTVLLDGEALPVLDGAVLVPVARDGRSHRVLVEVPVTRSRSGSPEQVEVPQEPPQQEEDDDRADASTAELLRSPARRESS
jgi:hypothetical protein